MSPQVSVLLPVRDAATTLVEALDSIAAQYFNDYELIAIDDHSADESLAILRQRARCDARIRVRSNPTPGLVPALNLGLSLARAPLIARMDADDRMHPRRLAAQVTGLGERTLIATQVSKFPAARVAGGYREYLAWQNRCLSEQDVRDEIYVESPFAHPSVLFRSEIILQLGGYRYGDFPEDYELWLRLNAQGEAMAKLPEVLLEWRESEGRLSRHDPRYRREAFDRLRADYLSRDPRMAPLITGERPLWVWGAGRRTRRRFDLLWEQGISPSAWIDIDPRKIGARIDRLPVHAPSALRTEDNGVKPFVLVYVTKHGARDQIGEYLQHLEYQRGEDYLMVG